MLLHFINFLYSIVAIALLLFGLLMTSWLGRLPRVSAAADGSSGISSSDLIPLTCYIVAPCLLLTSMLGCMAARNRSSGGTGALYMLLSIAIMAAFIALGTLLVLKPQASQQAFTDFWNSVSVSGRQKIQDTFKCCGLTKPTDRPTDSAQCPITLVPSFASTTSVPGCWPRFQTFVGQKNLYLLIGSYVMAVFAFLGVIAGLWVARDARRRQKALQSTRYTPAGTSNGSDGDGPLFSSRDPPPMMVEQTRYAYPVYRH